MHILLQLLENKLPGEVEDPDGVLDGQDRRQVLAADVDDTLHLQLDGSAHNLVDILEGELYLGCVSVVQEQLQTLLGDVTMELDITDVVVLEVDGPEVLAAGCEDGAVDGKVVSIGYDVPVAQDTLLPQQMELVENVITVLRTLILSAWGWSLTPMRLWSNGLLHAEIVVHRNTCSGHFVVLKK